MKKINVSLVAFLLIPVITCVLFCGNNSPVSNLIYLHDQKKTANSSQAHLAAFSSEGKVVLDFYADWCGPCRRMSPLIDSVAAIMPNVTFVKINRDHFLDLGNDFHITSIPTLIFLHNGKEIGRYDGKPLTEKTLAQLIINVYRNK